MKKIVLYFFLAGSLAYLNPILAQTAEKYLRVKVYGNEETFRKLAEEGLMPDHAQWKTGSSFTTDISEFDLATLKSKGLKTEILHSDAGEYYRSINQQKIQKSASCLQGSQLNTPANFNTGSMGGYLTYEEMLSEIDAMASQYPQLVKGKTPITGFNTWENRPIYWMKISDNPNTDEAEPEVFYNSMIHAREPMALMQLIYYMWYLLENYATHPEVKYLVDHTEMYFVPMVNPDGYIYNQTTNPNGGGLWRKNRRNNGGGNYGVDLNRNFSYQWGVSGISTNPAADNYLGPTAFSEPETQALKSFIESRQFVLSYTHHTFGNLLLFPYGYDYVETPEHEYFLKMTPFLVAQNNFANIHSVLLYPAAGDSDDWMYGDVSTKPKIYAMTPETGSDEYGFWPPEELIIPTSAANVDMNLYLARLALNYAEAKDLSPYVISSLNSYFKFNITRLGIPAGDFTVSIQPVSNNISSVGPAVNFSGMNLGEVIVDSIALNLNPSILQGEPIKFILQVNNGSFSFADTISKIYGNNTLAFTDNATALTNWTSMGGWNLTTEDFVSPSNSFTDSPFGEYVNNQTATLTTTNEIDLSNAGKAFLSFYAKWNIEAGYDYVQVLAQSSGSSVWTPLCGKYTKLGLFSQAEGQPLYDGGMSNWVKEEMDLSDFAGSKIKIRFLLKSDGAITADGFYFDDLKVEWIYVDPNVGMENQLSEEHRISIFPNPTDGKLSIGLDPKTNQSVIEIHDVRGKLIKSLIYINNSEADLSDLLNGIYFVTVKLPNGKSYKSKLVLIK